MNKIKKAIISVSNKQKLKLILPILKKFKIEIISSGGSFNAIKKMNYNCTEVSKFTGFSEMLDGRIKTLHPKIYGGILNIRKNIKHKKDLKKLNIPNIDLVVVNFYPFENKLDQNLNFKKLIENIDIGGPTLLRAAAKNFNDVTIICDPNDYLKLINEIKLNKGSTTEKFRKLMAAKAFRYSAYYDSVISNWFNKKLDIKFPEKKTIHGNLLENLRYGENPHQKGSLYSIKKNINLHQTYGKKLSYNNYNDIYAALTILKNLNKKQGTVIVKHANPCGISVEKNPIKSFKNALSCDPISAFGGIVAINSIIKKSLALELSKTFFEVVISNGFDKESAKILKKKKNIRLINCKNFTINTDQNHIFLGDAFLSQETDNLDINKNKFKFVTKKKPTINQIKSLKFAFNICKFVKSNAVVIVNNKSTIGIGAGQPSRLDSCKIAAEKALNFMPEKIMNSVAASDAFFPFSDGIEELSKKGVVAIIQPGGSINDRKIIKNANRLGISMVFAGTRHFKH